MWATNSDAKDAESALNDVLAYLEKWADAFHYTVHMDSLQNITDLV